MPTIFRKNGLRFFFYSNEKGEPPHLHISGRGGEAKVWLDPVKISESYGFKSKDRREILQIIFENVRGFRQEWSKWHES